MRRGSMTQDLSDERGGFIAFFDGPTIGEGAQCRVDAVNLADLIRELGPMLS
jgi:hypothetical protein